MRETEQELNRIYAVQRSADRFVEGLGLDGKTAQDALTALSERGFKCGIKLVRYGLEEKGRPLIQCVKAPTDIQDCLQLEVSVSARWQDPQRPAEELLRQASSSPINLATAICKIR